MKKTGRLPWSQIHGTVDFVLRAAEGVLLASLANSPGVVIKHHSNKNCSKIHSSVYGFAPVTLVISTVYGIGKEHIYFYRQMTLC